MEDSAFCASTSLRDGAEVSSETCVFSSAAFDSVPPVQAPVRSAAASKNAANTDRERVFIMDE
jgi:hypothetical protein